MNKRGSALLLVLVLTTAVLPAAGTLIYIARSDLASALDDYHNVKAMSAARGAVLLAEADLKSGGDGKIAWPDPDIVLEIRIIETASGWQVLASAHSGRAAAQDSAIITRDD